MKTFVQHVGNHDVVAHQLDDADRSRAAADLIERLVPTIAAGIHLADNLTLIHEQERLDALPDSAVIQRLRAIVAAEQAERREAVAGR